MKPTNPPASRIPQRCIPQRPPTSQNASECRWQERVARALLLNPPSKKIKLSSSLLVLAFCALGQIRLAQADTTFKFSLDENSLTSAGIYKMDGTLLKSLWKKRPLSQGPHSASWDNTDEDGSTLPVGNYQVKLIAHNLNYVWEGVVGNTSSQFTGSTVHHGSRPTGMAISGTNAFFASNFNEAQGVWRRISTTNPQAVVAVGRADAARNFAHVATDGINAYYANIGNAWLSSRPSFVVANKVSDNSDVIFSAGVAEPDTNNPYTPDEGWPSVINRQTGANNAPTGLAVQYHSGGTLLAVAHGGMNQVHLLNKTTGALVSILAVTNPGAVAFAPNGDLWVICSAGGARVACRYGNMTGTPALVRTITGLSDPLAISVDPRLSSNVVAIADGGTSQQVKAYSSTGAALWTLGTAGGYANGNLVTANKFWFLPDSGDPDPAAPPSTAAFLAFASDGSFWVEDRGNRRTLHFSAARTLLEQIASIAWSRICAVDPNNPTRVFSNFLEYQVDYSKPLEPANGSWSLVRNWGWGNANAASEVWGFHTVRTLSNGRTYGLVGTPWENPATKLYELQSTGLRDTGITLNDIYGDGISLEADGALHSQKNINGQMIFYRQSLTHFDGANNPQWGAKMTLASASAGPEDPVYQTNYSYSARTKLTSSDVVISFDPTNSNTNATSWHLGGVQKNATDWLWKASRTGWMDGLGSFQNHAIDNSVQTTANFVDVLDRNIFYGYHGEFWMYQLAGGEGVGQANQTMHFYDNGLFVGQFGQAGYWQMPAAKGDGAPVAGQSGNALTWSVVREPSNNEVYLYMCDESSHSGVHRWRLDGINTIKEIIGSGPRDGTIQTRGYGTGLLGEYFDNSNFTALKTTRIDKKIDFDWGSGSATAQQTSPDTFSVRWTGLVEAPVTGTYTFTTTTDDGVRLWVNNQLLVDKSVDQGPTSWSGTIALQAGMKYGVRMEYYENGGGAMSQLFWAYPGQAQQIVPQDRLFPAGNSIFGKGLGLNGVYYSGNNFTSQVAARLDSEIDFNWAYNAAVPGQGQDNYSVRWSGEVQAIEGGTYKFNVVGDDTMKLWIGNLNGAALIDKTSPNPIHQAATVTLTAGQKYPIKLEFSEIGGHASARLEWKRPGQLSQTVVPRCQLYPLTLPDDLPDAAGLLVHGAIYEIEPVHAPGKRLDVAENSTANGANIHIWDDGNASNQRWKATDVGGGFWEFEPQHAFGKRMDVAGSGSSNGTNVHSYDANASAAQRYRLIAVGDGSWELEPQCAPGLRVDVEEVSTANGANVLVWQTVGASNQRWRFLRQ